jgi:hypothetical protein
MGALLTALIGLVAVLLILLLAIPVILIGLAVGIISLPFVLVSRALNQIKKPNHTLDGRRNVRVITPADRLPRS